jgi:hypothetical protein
MGLVLLGALGQLHGTRGHPAAAADARPDAAPPTVTDRGPVELALWAGVAAQLLGGVMLLLPAERRLRPARRLLAAGAQPRRQPCARRPLSSSLRPGWRRPATA